MSDRHDDEPRMVFASRAPGPDPRESANIILNSARNMWRNAQAIEDPVARAAAEAEAMARYERSRKPGQWSVAERTERLRDQRMYGE